MSGETDPQTDVWYHYTNGSGRQAIEELGSILESTLTDAPQDARLGDGVYLTKMPPEAGRDAICKNNYGRRTQKGYSKTEWVVKMTLPVKSVVPGHMQMPGRDVWIFYGNIRLSDVQAKIERVPEKDQ